MSCHLFILESFITFLLIPNSRFLNFKSLVENLIPIFDMNSDSSDDASEGMSDIYLADIKSFKQSARRKEKQNISGDIPSKLKSIESKLKMLSSPMRPSTIPSIIPKISEADAEYSPSSTEDLEETRFVFGSLQSLIHIKS